jgi:T-complex protein 1 subunit epsilon
VHQISIFLPLKHNNVVGGGGATELACSIEVAKMADKIESIEQYAVRAFADALEEIPMTLAENSGFNPIDYLSNIKKIQIEESNPFIGVDAMNEGTNNMYEQGIFESVNSKR